MKWLRSSKYTWIAAVIILALAAILAAVDGTGRWLPGWSAYVIVGGLEQRAFSAFGT